VSFCIKLSELKRLLTIGILNVFITPICTVFDRTVGPIIRIRPNSDDHLFGIGLPYTTRIAILLMYRD